MHQLSLRPSRLRLALAAGGLALGLSIVPVVPAHAAPTTTLTATPAVEIGQPVAVSLNVAGAADVYSYAMTFNYDPTLFDYVADSATDGPDGGYSSVVEGPGTVTLVYSRLGTSPALAVPPAPVINLPAALTFTSVGVGSGTITASISIVGTGGVLAAPIANAVSAPVAIAAVPVVVPSPSPSPSVSAAPAAATSSPVASATGDLALTGFDGGLLLLLAAGGLLVIGAGVLLVRRRIASVR
jgi:hypothetical protein